MIYKPQSHNLSSCSCWTYDSMIRLLLEEVKSVVIPVLDDIEAYSKNGKSILTYAAELDAKLSAFEACKLMQFCPGDWPKPLTQERFELIRKKLPHLDEWNDCHTCRHNIGTLAGCLYRSVMLLAHAFNNYLDDNTQYRKNDVVTALVQRMYHLYDRAHYMTCHFIGV